MRRFPSLLPLEVLLVPLSLLEPRPAPSGRSSCNAAASPLPRPALERLHNAPNDAPGPAADACSPVPSALDRLLRRVPLLPSEVARIEHQLPRVFDGTSPVAFAQRVASALERRPLDMHRQLLAQVNAALHEPAPASSADIRWREEARHVAQALVDGLLQLSTQRAAGATLYAVTNRVLGSQGTQAMQWGMHVSAVGGLLAQDAWLPWVQWMCQLPLPSLREGGWLEPLIAALPFGLHSALHGLEEARELLQQAVSPASALRLMLLGTVWALWQRRQAGTETRQPRTTAGRCVAAVPQRLSQLESAGHAARRLFAPPQSATASPTLSLLPIVAASTALLPRAGAAARGAVPVAATGLALASLLPGGGAQAQAEPARAGNVQDTIAVMEALWSAWDIAAVEGPLNLSTHAFTPAPEGRYAFQLREIRERIVSLYHQDDFLGALYTHRVPPGTLRLRDGTLQGLRVHSGTPVQLHPKVETVSPATWSPRTAELLAQLLAAVAEVGACYDHAAPTLECALRSVLANSATRTRAPAGVLARWIHRVEATLPDVHQVTTEREAIALRWLRARVAAAQASPVRGLAPDWPSGRPDPRSHLGHNLHLARGVLLQLSGHPALQALCAERGADPDQLTFPANGDVVARLRGGHALVPLFQVERPPVALAGLTTALRGLSALLHAPVRSSGILQVPEMLAYYDVPWPGAPLEEAPFAACLAVLDQRLDGLPPGPTRAPLPSPATGIPLDLPAAREGQQSILDRLWQVLDKARADAPVDLAEQAFVPDPGSPLARSWSAARHQLAVLFEATTPWLAMRQVDASFGSLRVADGHIVVAARTDQRRLHVATTGWTGRDANLTGLFRAARDFGCILPAVSIPLGSALYFHGIARRPAAQACHPQPLPTLSRRLQVLHQLHAQWLPPVEEASTHLQATGDLHDVLRLDTGLGAPLLYRPTLGTAAASAAYAALGPMALLLEHPAVQAALPDTGQHPLQVSVNSEGDFLAHLADGSSVALPVAQLGVASIEHAALLALLRTHARRAGGQVRSDGRVDAERVLALHGDCGRAAQARSDLHACAERVLGELRLGLRPHLLHAHDMLGPAQQQRVQEATGGFLSRQAPPDTTLLEYLGAPLVERGDFAWGDVERAGYFLSELARTPRAGLLQQALLEVLDWYGSLPGSGTSPSLLASLTVTAIVSDLGPPSYRDARIVLGYPLHKHANRGRTFAEVRHDFENYLYSLGRLPPALHAMATTIALQEDAPELVASDIPAELVFGGAVAAVDYVSGVHLAERIQRGLSRQMNFTALVTLSADLARNADVPEEVRQMALDARHLPLLDWQAFRSIDDERVGPSGAAAAAVAFDARVAQIDAAIGALLAPLPYRMALVQAELERVFPRWPGIFAPLPWNSTQLRLCNSRHWLRRSFPLHELYAAGELQRAAGDWSLCRVPDPQASRVQGYPQRGLLEDEAFAQMQPRFALLANINERFESAYTDYLGRARQGYGVLIEEALHLRPIAERRAIQRGDVEIFTLRTHEPQLEAQQETTADTAPYRGRFGVIYSVLIDGQRQYFQLFPLQSRIVPLTVEGGLPTGGTLETRKVRLRNGHYATVKVRRGTTLGVDWDAYASYRVPVAGRQSRVIVEPLLSSHPDRAVDPARSPFEAVVAPLQQDYFWLDPVALDHELRAVTSFEAEQVAPPLWLTAVDFIVPFVENLRKITSTDRNEFAIAAFGLYMEGVLILGPMLGGVVKILSRQGPKLTLPRAGELARTLGHGTLDALNPLAGSLTIARLGVSVVSRGISGDLHFSWSRIGRPPLRSTGWRWAMREGMAVLKEGEPPHGGPLHFDVRTVDNVRNVLVAAHPSQASLRGYHLVDPATLTRYGPLLQPGMDSSNAAGMLMKVGEGIRGSRSSAGKMFKPMKQGTKTSQDDPNEQQGIEHPHALDLAYPFLRPAGGSRPVRGT